MKHALLSVGFSLAAQPWINGGGSNGARFGAERCSALQRTPDACRRHVPGDIDKPNVQPHNGVNPVYPEVEGISFRGPARAPLHF